MKEVLLQFKHYTFYADGTYSCSHWRAEECSLWKIVDGQLLFTHAKQWEPGRSGGMFSGEGYDRDALTEKIKEAQTNAAIERILLEG